MIIAGSSEMKVSLRMKFT